MLRLNLGCGKDIREGWDNIDMFGSDPRVIREDVRLLMPAYRPYTVHEIWASDILEHISHREVDQAFASWCMLLRDGGQITVRVPDVRKQAALLLDGTWPVRVWSHMTFGGHEWDGNRHHCGFDEDRLRNMFLVNRVRVDGVEYLHHGVTGDIATSNNVNICIMGRKWE